MRWSNDARKKRPNLWSRWEIHVRLRESLYVHKSRVPFHSYECVRRSTAEFPCRFESGVTNPEFLIALNYPTHMLRKIRMLFTIWYDTSPHRWLSRVLTENPPITKSFSVQDPRSVPSASHPHSIFPLRYTTLLPSLIPAGWPPCKIHRAHSILYSPNIYPGN